MSKEKKMFSISESNDMMNAARDDEIRRAKKIILDKMAEGFCEHGTDMNCHQCEKETIDRQKVEIEDLKREMNGCDCGICNWCNGESYYHMKRDRNKAVEDLHHLLQANTHLELTACRVELEEYKRGLARLQGSLSACEDIRQRQKIDEYEEALIDIARGFIDYDQTELCREGMMITANEVILKYHKPTMAHE